MKLTLASSLDNGPIYMFDSNIALASFRYRDKK